MKQKAHYIFFDTETTTWTEDPDLKPKEDILVQLSYVIMTPEGEFITKDRLCKNTGKQLTPRAMSVNFITPEKIEHLQDITAYEEYTFLKDYIENNKCIAIAHNAPFDVNVLSRVGIDITNKCDIIDTLKIARIINDQLELVLEQNSLQYLKYYYKLYKHRDKLDKKLNIDVGNTAHNSLSDVADLLLLFQFIKKEYSVDDEKLIYLSNNSVLLDYVPNGTNKGKKFSSLSYNQLKWYSTSEDRDIAYTANHYMN